MNAEGPITPTIDKCAQDEERKRVKKRVTELTLHSAPTEHFGGYTTTLPFLTSYQKKRIRTRELLRNCEGGANTKSSISRLTNEAGGRINLVTNNKKSRNVIIFYAKVSSK